VEGRHVVLLVTDSHIVDEAMLGDINGLLNTGEITGMLPSTVQGSRPCAVNHTYVRHFRAVACTVEACAYHSNKRSDLLVRYLVVFRRICVLFDDAFTCAATCYTMQVFSLLKSRQYCWTKSGPG
jgi:hypothetical protein